jgi:predicted RNA-binding Zn ribbon-like protein
MPSSLSLDANDTYYTGVMSQPESLDPLLERRFRTGRPCLDFVHTGGVGRWAALELIHDAGDLERWLARVLGLERVSAHRRDLAPARRLREALWRLAHARATGRPLDPAEVAVVNAAAAAAPPVPRLDEAEQDTTEAATARQALSALARDAISLLGGPFGQRIRICAAPDCELLFVDASRPGHRRWCSMERCGNRAKTKAYRRRQDRSRPSPDP